MTSKYPPYGGGSRRHDCRECGAHRDDGAQISARGLCLECSHTRATESADQLAAGAGPHYEEWRRGVIAHAHRLARS